MPATKRAKRKLEDLNSSEPESKTRTLSDLTTNLKYRERNPPAESNCKPSSKRKSSPSQVSQIPSEKLPPAGDSRGLDKSAVVSQIPPEVFGKDVIKMMNSVRKVLVQSYNNISQKLQLDVIPNHLFDLKAHQLLSSKDFNINYASNSSVSLVKACLTEERHLQFIHHVKHNMCSQREFPGADIIYGILELILVSQVFTLKPAQN